MAYALLETAIGTHSNGGAVHGQRRRFSPLHWHSALYTALESPNYRVFHASARRAQERTCSRRPCFRR
ncbi:hypothetical protein N032_16255 [Pseudomonas syringae pv. pisi str. PP1]|nr:hypothetical protein N032_16255 [Pseudomonas syringae pv. pisi str. PP1]